MIGRIAGADIRSGEYGSKFVAPDPDVVEPGPDPVPGFPLFPADALSGSIIGSSGADRLTGSADDSVMFGLGGDDTNTGLAGADTMYGMGGNDAYVVDDGGDIVIDAAGGWWRPGCRPRFGIPCAWRSRRTSCHDRLRARDRCRQQSGQPSDWKCL